MKSCAWGQSKWAVTRSGAVFHNTGGARGALGSEPSFNDSQPTARVWGGGQRDVLAPRLVILLVGGSVFARGGWATKRFGTPEGVPAISAGLSDSDTPGPLGEFTRAQGKEARSRSDLLPAADVVLVPQLVTNRTAWSIRSRLAESDSRWS